MALGPVCLEGPLENPNPKTHDDADTNGDNGDNFCSLSRLIQNLVAFGDVAPTNFGPWIVYLQLFSQIMKSSQCLFHCIRYIRHQSRTIH